MLRRQPRIRDVVQLPFLQDASVSGKRIGALSPFGAVDNPWEDYEGEPDQVVPDRVGRPDSEMGDVENRCSEEGRCDGGCGGSPLLKIVGFDFEASDVGFHMLWQFAVLAG